MEAAAFRRTTRGRHYALTRRMIAATLFACNKARFGMAYDIEWGQQTEALLSGALAVWRVDGRIARDEANPCAFTVSANDVDVTVERITDDGDAPYWEVASHGMPSLPYAGIQGMLRAIRGIVDPERPAARLVIGTGDA